MTYQLNLFKPCAVLVVAMVAVRPPVQGPPAQEWGPGALVASIPYVPLVASHQVGWVGPPEAWVGEARVGATKRSLWESR